MSAREPKADAYIPVRVSKDLKDKARKRATHLGVSLSEYIRFLLVQVIVDDLGEDKYED
jgi:antitoxin component of RelBE/YafQ-DinJ toxin-antitoxin module